jgi:hypothetical protein
MNRAASGLCVMQDKLTGIDRINRIKEMRDDE